ncbi:MAG: Jag N-terminal domain-containing protein [Desulfobulbaceae bacterium]|nr:Jag N-terminal domain-containing protein [Desulfobulbaceae bacterium]
MSAQMEYSGKDVNDAINKACSTLSLTREELDIEVLSPGSAGIFGLCRRKAKILVSRKEQVKQTTKDTADAHPEEEAEATPEETYPDTTNDEDTNLEATGNGLPAFTPEMLDTAKTELLKVLELMGYPSEVTITQEKNKAVVHISGEHVDDIIGSEGQVLDSLQYLLRKMLGKKFLKKVMIALDAGDFRAQRANDLQDKALKLAEEVKETSKTRTIPALNPAERRIVHMALQNDKTIRSRSVGEGLYKKILIYLPGKGKRKPPRKRGKGNPRKNASQN